MPSTSQLFSQWLGLARPLVARVEAVDSDAAAHLAAIHAASFTHGWCEEEFESLLSDRASIADGLYIGKQARPCGFILSRRVLDEAEILSIAIDPSHRQRGLSYQLLHRHRETLEHLGIRTLHLEVDENNKPAIALYSRAGFEITGRRRGYYAQPDGSRTTALTMSLKV